MKVSEKLYESVKDIWSSYYEHPFVKGIGEGNLDIEKFKFYMIQDYLYLLDYAKIYALGIVKADDEEIMQGFSNMVNGILNGEMSIHRSYMKRLGITSEDIKNTDPNINNTSYTHYMLAIAQTGNLAELTVALLACMWSYQEIGKQLSKVPNSTEHEFYGEWIRGYISQEYKDVTKWVIDLTDELSKDMSEKQVNKLIEIFINTSKYEYMFWDMAYNEGM